VQLTIRPCCLLRSHSLLLWGICALPALSHAQSYYGGYYQQNSAKPFDAKLASGRGQPSYMSPTRDLYNKHFYHRPSVSPYMNLGRPAVGSNSTAYHTYVRPEQQRRQQQAQKQSDFIAARKRETTYHGMNYGAVQPKIGAASKPRPNAYYNQWYGRR
jgi:hypothetical protein